MEQLDQPRQDQLVDPEDKAVEMAYAEKPFRDEKIRLIEEHKQKFADRVDELRQLVADGKTNQIKPNDDENLYASDGAVKPKALHGEEVGRHLATDPVTTAKIAKALLNQEDVRAQRAVTKDNPDLAHPQSLAIDALKEDLEQIDLVWGGSGRASLFTAGRELAGNLEAKVVDPSRSVAGDKAAEAAGAEYANSQKQQQELEGILK